MSHIPDSDHPLQHLSDAEVDALAAELDELREAVLESPGHRTPRTSDV